MKLHPSDLAVLEALDKSDGLTSAQLSVVTGYTQHTVRQCTYRLRKAGYRVMADRVFRLRKADKP